MDQERDDHVKDGGGSLARIRHRNAPGQHRMNFAHTASRLNGFIEIADESSGSRLTRRLSEVGPPCPVCRSVHTEVLEFMAHRPYEVFCCFQCEHVWRVRIEPSKAA